MSNNTNEGNGKSFSWLGLALTAAMAVIVFLVFLLLSGSGKTTSVAPTSTAATPTQDGLWVTLTPTLSYDGAVAATLTAIPTTVPTNTLVASPTQIAEVKPLANGECLMENVGSFEEQTSGSAHLIQFGTGGREQIMDFYPRADMGGPITIIAPAMSEPIGVNGYGSLHEVTQNSPDCNIEINAVGYTQARLQYGHSGVTLDVRGGNFVILTNEKDLNREAMYNQLSAFLSHIWSNDVINAAINNWFRDHPQG